MASPSVLWELRGRTGKPVTCYLYPRRNDVYRLTVWMGENEIHFDEFKVEADALAHAVFLMDDYTRAGWTEQYRRDPRL